MDGKIFEKLIDVSECAFFISKSGGDMEITYASRKFYSMLQYSKEEFEEKYNNSLMAVILPEEKQKVKNLIARQFAAKLDDMIKFLIPNYAKEGKTSLVIAIGCTGGKHRSVTLARVLYDKLIETREYGIRLEHRDIGKDALLKK